MITPAYSLTATERLLPCLALDFTTASLDARVTVSRALNTATRINSNGLIEIINANLPRFDFTLNTGGACKGLLIEQTRDNIIRYSSEFTQAASWSATSAGGGSAPTYTGNTTIAPDGTNTAQIWTFVAPVSGDRSVISQTSTGLATGYWSSTAYVKAGRPQDVGKIISIKETQGATYTLVTLTDQWQRPESINTSALTTHGMAFELRPLVGTSTGTVQAAIWGAQTEAGAYPTSYIPNTGTSTVTRNADVTSMATNQFPYNATQGTIVVNFQYTLAASNVDQFNRTIASLAGTNPLSDRLYFYNKDGKSSALVQVGGATQANITVSGVQPANTPLKIGLAYAANNFAFSQDGAAPGTASSGSVPTATTLFIGCASASTVAPLNGHIRQVFYFPFRLTNAELQAKTA